MTPLHTLIGQARDLGEGRAASASMDAEHEVARQMQICNACRYCEGFCAVFPAMTRRLHFGVADVHYLANLCHNCGACLHACQYAPPHEFAVNVPQAMARVRVKTYALHAWPSVLGRAYERNGLTLCMTLALALALFLALGVVRQGSWAQLFSAAGDGNFYRLFPHGLMVWMFAPVFVFACVALAVGVTRFWRGIEPPGHADTVALKPREPRAAWAQATHEALTLKYLDGGHGEGCHNEDDAWTHKRRRAHHLTFYGFALCFASTSVATVYHYAMGWVAPYGWTTLPKILGGLGGVMMTFGAMALGVMHLRRHKSHLVVQQRPMDLGFIGLLAVVGASGLLLALLRQTAAMPLMLCVHLGSVMAFFATMPYSKFAHGVYRFASLLKWALERRRPLNLRLGGD
jgi:citrate/tricarballylate utilization protein